MRYLALAVVLLGCTGCGLSADAEPSHDRPAPALSDAKRFAAAQPAVRGYLQALADGRAQDTVRFTDTTAPWREQQTLTELREWFAPLPIGDLRLKLRRHELDRAGATGVLVEMNARIGPKPLSTWVDLGRRLLVVRWDGQGWKVAGDATEDARIKQRGLSLFGQVEVLSGKGVSVIHERLEAGEAARQILADAEAFLPSVRGRYGTGPAAMHALVYVVRDKRQGERLSDVKVWRKEVPQGFVLDGVAYIEWPEWSGGGPLERDAVIAHELTHVISDDYLGTAPHSVFEGLAMVHEDRFAARSGFHIPLGQIAAVYRSGSFPSIDVWRRRVTDWGIRSPQAVSLCYDDAMAMVAVILERHGGPAALGRLARAFTRMHVTGSAYSAGQVRQAFRVGLGVSFEQVVAEAHSYARANAR
jgi:hypothetical protein